MSSDLPAEKPPSTTKLMPVIQRDSSDARNRTAIAMSCAAEPSEWVHANEPVVPDRVIQ